MCEPSSARTHPPSWRVALAFLLAPGAAALLMAPAMPAHEIGLYLRCDLPGRGQGCRPGAPALQHRRDDAPPRRNIRRRRAGRSCRAAPRSGGVAWLKGAGRTRQYHPHAAAAPMPRGEPGGLAAGGIARRHKSGHASTDCTTLHGLAKWGWSRGTVSIARRVSFGSVAIVGVCPLAG